MNKEIPPGGTIGVAPDAPGADFPDPPKPEHGPSRTWEVPEDDSVSEDDPVQGRC